MIDETCAGTFADDTATGPQPETASSGNASIGLQRDGFDADRLEAFIRETLGPDMAVEPEEGYSGDADQNHHPSQSKRLILADQYVEPLIAKLTDGSENLRAQAAEALGILGDRRAVKPLINSLLRDRDNMVRRRATEALGALADQSAVLPLISVLGDSDVGVRLEAVDALRLLGDRRAVFPLIVALDSSDADLRKKIAEAFGALGDRRAEFCLNRMLNDSEADVRIAAAEALAALNELQPTDPATSPSADGATEGSGPQDDERPFGARRLSKFLNPASYEASRKTHPTSDGKIAPSGAQPVDPPKYAPAERTVSVRQARAAAQRATGKVRRLEPLGGGPGHRNPGMLADTAEKVSLFGDSYVVKWDEVPARGQNGTQDDHIVLRKLGTWLKTRPRISKLTVFALLLAVILALALAQLVWTLS